MTKEEEVFCISFFFLKLASTCRIDRREKQTFTLSLALLFLPCASLSPLRGTCASRAVAGGLSPSSSSE